jgi:hypothetical protein
MIIPKTVALDTSQWVDLIRNASGPDLHLQREAKSFPKALLEQGYSIVLSFHHLQELLAHENFNQVAQRLSFVKEIGFLSWIGSKSEEPRLGSIIDIIATEARVAFEAGGDASRVRRGAKALIIRSGSGSDIVDDDPRFQALLSDWAQARQDRSRASVAISAFPFIKPDMTVGRLKAGRLATNVEVAAAMTSSAQRLSSDISQRSDKRITNPRDIASDFNREVMAFRQTQPNTVPEIVDAGFLIQGIDRDEIQDHLRVTDLLDLGLFRSQLRTAIEGTDLPFNTLKRKILRKQLPYFLISNALKPIQDAQSERAGSNLVDRELACIAPYVDVLYVDKRTAEFFRQAIQKNPALACIIGNVRKVVSWRNVLLELQKLA